jgi:hypothetical protein
MDESKKRYLGRWAANDGSTYAAGYEYTNLKTARKDLRAIAMGNTFSGNTGSWAVTELHDGYIRVVASGVVRN